MKREFQPPNLGAATVTEVNRMSSLNRGNLSNLGETGDEKLSI